MGRVINLFEGPEDSGALVEKVGPSVVVPGPTAHVIPRHRLLFHPLQHICFFYQAHLIIIIIMKRWITDWTAGIEWAALVIGLRGGDT
ncbi:hypothetical protein QJS04_geneDACA016998 [Acorus gramineus]|uniref:Uncharacterized protein n=1 Tax=Acorus gramineus TaxID=55184 RepID=A0AAV9AN74_ACOGR|nr:hypothetical protein QJS04_geneDACA016998 [Acorus gramineus]